MTKNVILYAEDSPEMRKALKRFLEYELPNCSLEEFQDGIELRDRLENKSDDVMLVLTDGEMPRMGGLDLIARYSERFKEIPFILFSGDSYSVEHSKKIGARDSLDKIHGPMKLVELLKKYI